jgi:hypothetical protein
MKKAELIQGGEHHTFDSARRTRAFRDSMEIALDRAINGALAPSCARV